MHADKVQLRCYKSSMSLHLGGNSISLQTDAWTYSFRAWQCPIMPIALFCYGEYRRSRSWNQEVGSKLFTQFKLPLVQFPLFLRGVAAGVVREVGTWVIIIHKPLSILSENSYPIASAITLHEWAL